MTRFRLVYEGNILETTMDTEDITSVKSNIRKFITIDFSGVLIAEAEILDTGYELTGRAIDGWGGRVNIESSKFEWFEETK